MKIGRSALPPFRDEHHRKQHSSNPDSGWHWRTKSRTCGVKCKTPKSVLMRLRIKLNREKAPIVSRFDWKARKHEFIAYWIETNYWKCKNICLLINIKIYIKYKTIFSIFKKQFLYYLKHCDKINLKKITKCNCLLSLTLHCTINNVIVPAKYHL